MKRATALSFTILFTTMLLAQDPPTYGVQLGVDDLEQIEATMLTIDGFADGNSRILLNEQSVKSYMMPPRDERRKEVAACYIISSALEYYMNIDTNFKENLSPDYIYISLYGQSKSPKPKEIFKLLNEEGTISANFMPYGSTSLIRGMHTLERFTISKYMHIITPATPGKRKVFDTKKAIMRGNPVILELKIDEPFKSLGSGDIFWNPTKGTKKSTESTYVLAVSYDEEKSGIEILNCWGRKWGNRGHTWVKYEDFEDLVVNAYVIKP